MLPLLSPEPAKESELCGRSLASWNTFGGIGDEDGLLEYCKQEVKADVLALQEIRRDLTWARSGNLVVGEPPPN